MKTQALLVAFTLLAFKARAENPFRQALDPTLDTPGAMTTEAPKDDLVVADKNRALRWQEHARWVGLDIEVADLKSSLKSDDECTAIAASVDQVLGTLDYEKDFYAKNCLVEKPQLRACMASHLRFDEMSDAVARLKRDIHACVSPDSLRPIRSHLNGNVGLGISDRHYALLDSHTTDNDFDSYLGAAAEGEWGLAPSVALRSKLDSRTALEKSNTVGQQYLDFGAFYASTETVFDLGASIANDRGFYDVSRTNVVSENRYGLQSSALFRADERDFLLAYRPTISNDNGHIYNGVRHEFNFNISGERVEHTLGYRLSYVFFRSTAGALYPDWSTTRFALDMSELFAAKAPDSREFVLGIEERRDSSHVVRLYPYLDFKQRFGPFDGSGWLSEPLTFARSFESNLHLSIRSEENRLTPSNQIAEAEGELTLKSSRWKMPLRLGVSWVRSLIGVPAAKSETFVTHFGVYPEFRLSGRFFVEAQAEYLRSMMFDKASVDPRLWVFPYESYNQFFVGLKTRYDF